MRKFLCLLLIALTTAALVDAQPKGRKPPRKPARITIKGTPVNGHVVKSFEEAPKTFGLIVDKYVSTYDVNADGTGAHVWEVERRCTNEACLPTVKRFELPFNASLQKVEVLEAGIVKPDGKRVLLPAAAIKSKPTPHAEASEAFSSLHSIEIAYDNLVVGEVGYFKIRVQTTRPVFENQFEALELFPLLFDWKSIEINISAPKELAIFTESPGLEGGQITEENGRSRWRWTKKNITALEIEPAMHDLYSISPRFAATTFRSFDQLGAAFWQNVKAKAVITPEVRSLADEITKDITDPKQQAYAIYDWANRNIRYLSIVLDRGGVIPHSTTEILANRYGDCKDYTTIIYALLKAKGIESVPLMVRSEMGDWFPEVATPFYFNHAVLYIPSLKLIADATAPNTRLGLIPQMLVGKKAVLAGERTGIIEIPRNNPDDNDMHSETEIVMQPNGTVKAISRNTYKGRMEMVFRPMFGNSMITTNSEAFVKVLLSYFGMEGSGKVTKIGDPFRLGEPFAIELETELPGYTTFTPTGKFPLPIGINLVNMLELEQLFRTETRRTNLISGAVRMKEAFAIKFPERVTPGPLPQSTDFRNAAGQYKNEFKIADGAVHVTRELVLFKDVVTPAEYPQARELIRKAVESYNIEIAYAADRSLLTARVREANRLSKHSGRTDAFLPEPKSAVLRPAEVTRMENRLKTSPNDLETRRRLIRHYSSYELKKTARSKAAYAAHRLWFTKNHPGMSAEGIYGFAVLVDSFEGQHYEGLKAEWTAQIEANKSDAAIRLNAAEFFKTNDDSEAAKQALVAGVALHPERYEFALMLTGLHIAELDKLPGDASPGKRLEILKAIEQYGETTLQGLKSNRSSERDYSRNNLLIKLTPAVFELGKLDRAKELAMELILEFAQNESDIKFEDSSHVANIILGRVALRNGEIAKAKQHLIASVKAPLRQDYAGLTNIDMDLARELLDKGEKNIVSEYLRLCESLSNLQKYPESYFTELKSLKAWQEQIKLGKKPSFKFGEDAPLP